MDGIPSSKLQIIHDVLAKNAGMKSFHLDLRKLAISYRPQMKTQFPGPTRNTPNLHSWVWAHTSALDLDTCPKTAKCLSPLSSHCAEQWWKAHLGSSFQARARSQRTGWPPGRRRVDIRGWHGVRTCERHVNPVQLSWGLSREKLRLCWLCLPSPV